MKVRSLAPKILIALILLAAVGCGRMQNPAAPADTQAQVAPTDDLFLVGYARNVSGTIRVLRGGIVSGYLASNDPLYDDDQLQLLTRKARLDAESVYPDVPTVTILQGEDGYWDAEKGTLNPPAPDWSYSRGIMYSAFW